MNGCVMNLLLSFMLLNSLLHNMHAGRNLLLINFKLNEAILNNNNSMLLINRVRSLLLDFLQLRIAWSNILMHRLLN